MITRLQRTALGLMIAGLLGAGWQPATASDVDPSHGTEVAPSAGGAEVSPAHPLSLDEAVRLAFDRNPDMRAAAERIEQAKASLGEATSAFFPHVSTRLSYTRTDNPSQAFGMILSQRRFSFDQNFNNPGPTQDVRPEIIGVLPLFRGGQDYQRRLAAELGVDAARFERDAVRNSLADAVVAGYYALLAAPEQVQATSASIDAVTSALTQARARFDEGTALKSDVLSLEVRLAAAREAHVSAQNAVELARTGLRVLLGLPASASLQVAPAPKHSAPELPETFEGSLAEALKQRPELQASARLVQIREHELKAERGAYLPRINAMGTYGQDATDLGLSSSKDNWTFGAVAELDLFSGFRTSERVRGAERRLAEAREDERKTRLEVERDVKAAMLNLNEARQRAQVTEAAVAAAEEALRLVQEQYQAGAVIITRYLDAEVARTDARSRAIAARYDARRAEGGVQKAIGYWAAAYGSPTPGGQ